jgi:electron transfer flavoprotein alpha subunit
MSNGILVLAEHRGGTFNKTSFEAIAAAQAIAADLQEPANAVVLGSGVQDLARQITSYRLSKVIYADNEGLAEYTADGYSDALEQIVRNLDPRYVVMAHTYMVRDFAPKLAARFSKGLISDCIRATVTSPGATFTRRIFMGKVDADVTSDGDSPVFVTFQSGAFRADQAAKGSADFEKVEVKIGPPRALPEPPFQEVKQAVDLTRADVIVAIGRGIKSKENIVLAEQLAAVLGGDVAASRPICDAEWLPIDRQIGSSGQTVSPRLYIALGISGAIQHLVGMKNSGIIVAVNKDPEAPIFDIADYGIIGDLFEVVPVLTEEIKKLKG